MRLLACVVAFVAACGSAKPACPVVPAPVDAQPFLWRAQRADGSGGIVWLYGTIHNGGAGDVPPAAWQALEAAPRFVSEVGDVEPDRERLRELVRITSGPSLDQLLPADDWWDLRDALRGVIKEDELKRTRPWYAMARLTATAAPPPDPTMDFALTERARQRGVPIDPLESYAEQLTALANTVTVADLQQALRERATIRCTLAGLLGLYRTGDLEAMRPRLVVAGSQDLLEPRNRLWLPKLERYFAERGAFVAIGLGHMIGDTGIPALLGAAGYRVERVTSDRRDRRH